MKYTEKTSGAQIEALLTEMYGGMSWCDFDYDNSNIGISRVPSLPSIKKLYDFLEQFEINPLFVTIGKNGWGHLTMWFCNWDGTEIDIETY